MSEKFIDVSFMKRTEIVQAIRNAESLDKAVSLMNGFAANGWIHLWDDAKHPDGSSMKSQWQSSQQATIERLTEQRNRLLKAGNSILKAMDLCNTEMVYQADFELRALIAEIEASK